MSIHVYTSLFDVVILFVDGIRRSGIFKLSKKNLKKKKKINNTFCAMQTFGISHFSFLFVFLN